MSLHALVTGGSSGQDERLRQITEILSRKRKVKVAPGGTSLGRSRVLLIDHEAIWNGLLEGQTTFSNVAFPDEEGVAFRDASEQSQRLRSLPHGRVQRVDQGPKGAASYKAVLDISVPQDPDYKDKNGESALYVAAGRDGDSAREELLTMIKYNADPDCQVMTKVFEAGEFVSVPGGTPLIAAIAEGNLEHVKLLLTLGASVDKRIQAVGSDGKLRERTPLTYAADRSIEEEEAFTLNDVKASVGLGKENVWEEIRQILAEPTKSIMEYLSDPENTSLAAIENLQGNYPLHAVCAAAGASMKEKSSGRRLTMAAYRSCCSISCS